MEEQLFLLLDHRYRMEQPTVVITNEKGELALLNAAARELLGDGLEEWLGRMAGPLGVGRATFDRALGGE